MTIGRTFLDGEDPALAPPIVSRAWLARALHQAFDTREAFDLHTVRLHHPQRQHRENFSGIDMTGVQAAGYCFGAVVLQKVCLDEALLDGADLSLCLLNGGWIRAASCFGAHFIRATLSGANFSSNAGTTTNLSHARLDGAWANYCDFSSILGYHLSACGSEIRFSDFSFANLEGADFRNSDLTGTSFSHANLRGMRFEGTTLDGVDWTNAILDESDMQRIPHSDASGKTFWHIEWRPCDASTPQEGQVPPIPASVRNNPYDAEFRVAPAEPPLTQGPLLPDFEDDDENEYEDDGNIYLEGSNEEGSQEDGDGEGFLPEDSGDEEDDPDAWPPILLF